MIERTPIPQRHQLTLKMEAPLWDDQQVESEIALQSLSYLYSGKLVWVQDEACWFVFVRTDIRVDSNNNSYDYHIWKRQNARVILTSYDTETNYVKGESVFLRGKIYSALQDITQYPSPPNTPIIPYNDDLREYWIIITGDNEFIRYEFDDMSNFIIQSDIKEPIFTCWVYDDEYNYINAHPSIRKIDENSYEVSFWEYDFDINAMSLKQMSGYISFK